MKVTEEKIITQVEKSEATYTLTVNTEELRIINAALNACQGAGYYDKRARSMFFTTPTTGGSLFTIGTYKFDKTTKVE